MKTKEFILSIFFVVSVLIIYSLFPARDIFQQLMVMVVLLMILPICFNKFILKKFFSAFKITIGDWKTGIIWFGISLIVGILIFIPIIYFLDLFGGKYGVPKMILDSFWNFIYYEFVLVLPVVFLYDFFFRGFLFSVFREKMDYWVIFVQAALFLLLVVVSGSLSWLMVAYLVGAPLAGLILYKSESIIYSMGFQFFLIIILDVSFIYLTK